MAHPKLEAHRRAYQARVAGVRTQLAQGERAQLAEPNLTAAQRRRNIRHLRTMAESRLAQLRQEFQAGIPAVLHDLHRGLFNLPPQTLRDLSWRDALTRASAIESQAEALRLLDVSTMVGDEIMVKALGYCAAPNPVEHPPKWPAVVARWCAHDPTVADRMADFDAIWQEANDRQVQFRDSIMFGMPSEQQPPDHDQLPALEPVSEPTSAP